MIGQIVGEKYRVTEAIGEGGMGAVYAADRVDTGETVAVKVLHDKYDDERSMERFDREARVGAAIDSPNVVRVFDTGRTEEGRPYMAMELLRGEELGAIFARTERLHPEVVCKVAVQALRGLHAAHETGVIHRDIKPANIFVAYDDDGQATVKVLDFGIAKFRPTGEISGVTKGLTQTGALMGSPLYMSPEQAKGLRNIDRRSDLWSLGIVLYAALTGECPHDSIDTLGQLIISICSVPPEPVQEAAPWVSPEIADFVERALRINMDERYATAEVMLADVLRIPGSTEPLTRKDFEAVDESARQVVAPLSRVSQLRQDSSSDQMLSASGNELTVVDSARPQSIPLVNSGTHNGLSSDEVKPQVTGTSKGLVVATGLALLVAAGLAVKLFGTKAATSSNAANTTSGAQATATPQKASRTAASTAKASARATAEAVLSKVIVQLDVQPLGAQVFLGDTLLGPSSEPLELQHSEKALALRLVKAGYQDKTIQLVPNKAQKKKVYLVSAKGRSPKGPAAPPVPKPKAPKRANGDLEQPW